MVLFSNWEGCWLWSLKGVQGKYNHYIVVLVCSELLRRMAKQQMHLILNAKQQFCIENVWRVNCQKKFNYISMFYSVKCYRKHCEHVMSYFACCHIVTIIHTMHWLWNCWLKFKHTRNPSHYCIIMDVFVKDNCPCYNFNLPQ